MRTFFSSFRRVLVLATAVVAIATGAVPAIGSNASALQIQGTARALHSSVVPVSPPITSVEDATTIVPVATTTTITVVTNPSAPTTIPGSTPIVTSVVVTPSSPTMTTAIPAVTSSTVVTVPVVTVPVVTVPVVTVPVVTVPTFPTVPLATVPLPNVGAPETTTTPSPSTTLPKSASSTTVPAAATNVGELKVLIDNAVNAVPNLSVHVVLDGAGTITERDADVPRIPASTQKLYTGGAALLALGPNATLLTEVRASAITSPNGVIVGDLVLRGGGDPTLTTKSLAELADVVAKTGVKTVTGSLVVDESRFDLRRRNDGWKPKFVPGEVGSLSAFVVNGNRRGGVLLEEPALANLGLFRVALKARGVVVVGGDRKGALPDGGPVLARRESPPLQTMLAHMLKESDNTYAETFLKELGARRGDGSTAGGIAAVRQQFGVFGVTPPSMSDGSGLSSLNRSSARQQVQWLQKLRSSPIGNAMIAALPTSCVDGTMKNRLCGTSGARRVTAKTGTLDFITGLSGYTTTSSGKSVTFSFLFNGTTKSTIGARVAIDRSLVAITSAKF